MHNLRVYIAGPMTGLPEFNFPAFDAMEAALAKTGFLSVYNPAVLGRLYGTDKEHSFYMKKAIERLLTCQAIIALPGWENSKGARLEVSIARMLGFTELHYPMTQLSPTHVSTADKNQEGNSHGTVTPDTNTNLSLLRAADGSFHEIEFTPGPGYAYIPK